MSIIKKKQKEIPKETLSPDQRAHIALALIHVEALRDRVKLLWDTYERHGDLNELINIEGVVPASLDDWWFALCAKVEELKTLLK